MEPLSLEYTRFKDVPSSSVIVRTSHKKHTSNIYKIRDFKGLTNLCEQRKLNEALQIMEEQGLSLSRNNAYLLLQECMQRKDIECTRRLQYLMISSGLNAISVLDDHLIRLFAMFGKLVEANQAFERVSEPSACTWSSIISAHANLGFSGMAIEMYQTVHLSGLKSNKYIYHAVLKACMMTVSSTPSLTLKQVRVIHDQIIKSRLQSDVILGSALADVYAKCGRLKEAHKIFADLASLDSFAWNIMISGYARCGDIRMALELLCQMEKSGAKPDIISWTALIAGYAQHGKGHFALQCFEEMQCKGIRPNKVAFLTVLRACSSVCAIEQGRLIHKQIIMNGLCSDLVLGSSLIDMYAKCKKLNEASDVFDRLPNRDIVCWNTMIAGHAQHGDIKLAIQCFERMEQSGIKPDIVSWTSVIAGYVQHGDDCLALDYFVKMQQQGLEPDKVTYLVLMKACGNLGAIGHARGIHNNILKHGLLSDLIVGNALIDMYANLGSLREAQEVFDRLPAWDLVSWNTLIAGYAKHGDIGLALPCFENMELSGIKPNQATLNGILTSCSRNGLVKEGCWYFRYIQEIHGVTADISDYNCIADILGRAGYFQEAKEVLEVTIQPNIFGWTSLLTACKIYGEWELGAQCFNRITPCS